MSETLGPPPSRSPEKDPVLGTVIAGKYRIVSRLASGGMGTVYRAEQQALGREVALKLLHPGNMEGEDSTASRDDFSVLEKRFSREAAILAKLQHPNIVTVYDYGAIEGTEDDPDKGGRPRFYMVMELIGGRTLQQRLVERKVLPWDEAVRLFRQIARGLREAHAVGVVHRDLKPANVMIVRDRDGEEQVKLLDFGIGKILDDPGSPSLPPTADTNPPNSEDELTRDGRFVGSPQYMSPEQVTGEGIDERSDVYSFGVMLYRCLAGKNPFHRHSVTMIMLAHLNDHPRIWPRSPIPRCPRGSASSSCAASRSARKRGRSRWRRSRARSPITASACPSRGSPPRRARRAAARGSSPPPRWPARRRRRRTPSRR
ncbi:MAG: serine/threonine protein kinase [Myxococcales bacterium]|nr:serine/threonine protein kinase [Myxococcales bacterium]